MRIDPNREWHMPGTGIYTRARGSDGQFGSFDIVNLDKESLMEWMKSKEPEFLRNLVAMLLDHKV